MLPTFGGGGLSLPLVTLQVPRHEIEAIEVARDPASGWGARKADLIKKDGGCIPLWRYSDWEVRWNWAPGKGWRESTASTHITSQPALEFRLMGALFGFVERLAASLSCSSGSQPPGRRRQR